MLKQITTAFFLLCSVLVTGQDFKKIEEEIKSLSGDEIKEYWIALNQVDQTITTDYNPKFYERNIVNLYKTAALIKYHGYPVVKEYGYPAYVTPWLAWVHCASASLKHYTFPIILEGRDKQQLADGQFPDYFVGGFISQNYGLDMVYDKDFYTDDISPITRFLYRMEEDRHEIDLKELQRLSEEAIKLLYPQSVMEIGKW
ncbi:MAG: hypothetical protein DI539_16830 [Flavobacterium psychrophilum]|nr:MAG: hypothetical protein DI539_16830 [Flavobacterium psychrophilum]